MINSTSLHRYIFLGLSLIFTACNGQIKTPPLEKESEAIAIVEEQLKMKKTQGTYSFQLATGPHLDTNVCIMAILEDRSDNIWAATMGEGVYRYDGKSFNNFTVNEGLVSNLVYCMIEDKDGNIWFGTADGVSRYDGRSFTNFPFSDIVGNSRHMNPLKTLDPIKETFKRFTEVWSMVQDKTGKIWLGTTDGVYGYDGVKFTSIADLDASKHSQIKHVSVSSIAEDEAGNIWFTSWADGLCRYDGTSITQVTAEGFNTMLIDRNGNLWLGRRGDRKDAGVYRYDGKSFAKLLAGMGYISEIKEDEKGNLWFTNAQWKNHELEGGIIHFNPTTSEIISHFTTKNGLSHEVTTALTLDRSGNVWLGMCGMTLTRFDGKTFSHFYSE